MDRMLIEGQRYPVVMSQTLYRWLMFGPMRKIIDAGPKSWTHGGRIAFGRVETLYTHGKQVGMEQGGRVVRLTQKDARTLIGLLEHLQTDPDRPTSSRSLLGRLRWQVGDVDHIPGQLSEHVRVMRLVPLGNGTYVSQYRGLFAAPGDSA